MYPRKWMARRFMGCKFRIFRTWVRLLIIRPYGVNGRMAEAGVAVCVGLGLLNFIQWMERT